MKHEYTATIRFTTGETRIPEDLDEYIYNGIKELIYLALQGLKEDREISDYSFTLSPERRLDYVPPVKTLEISN